MPALTLCLLPCITSANVILQSWQRSGDIPSMRASFATDLSNFHRKTTPRIICAISTLSELDIAVLMVELQLDSATWGALSKFELGQSQGGAGYQCL